MQYSFKKHYELFSKSNLKDFNDLGKVDSSVDAVSYTVESRLKTIDNLDNITCEDFE